MNKTSHLPIKRLMTCEEILDRITAGKPTCPDGFIYMLKVSETDIKHHQTPCQYLFIFILHKIASTLVMFMCQN